MTTVHPPVPPAGRPKVPPYIVHQVREEDVTVDWFFGPGHRGRKVLQFLLVVLGWFLSILPIVITASSIIFRHDAYAGWWSYQEGFDMWDWTIIALAFLIVCFIIGFLVLNVLHRVNLTRSERVFTQHQDRLAERLDIARILFARRYGPQESRLEQRSVRIQPHSDLETFELRDEYRAWGAE